MKKVSFIIVLIICSSSALYSQRKVSSDTITKKTEEVKITQGASGVRRSIGYKFSSAVTVADPGSGIFRYNNSSISKVRWIVVDNTDISGEDQTNWYSTWDKSTGATGRGSIDIAEPGGKLVCMFNITGVFVKEEGYWKIPVEYFSGTLPVNGATYYYVFNRIAHRKPEPVQGQQQAPSQQPAPLPVPDPASDVNEAPAPEQQKIPVQITQPEQNPQVAENPVPVQESKPVVQEQAEPAVPPVSKKQPARAAQTAQTIHTTRSAEDRRTTQKVPLPATTAQPAKAEPETKTAQQVQQTQPSQMRPATQTTVAAPQVEPVQQAVPEQKAQITAQAFYNQDYQAAPYNQVSQVKRPVDIPNPYANMATGTGRAHRKWYRGIIEAGYGWGIGEYGINNFRFNFINGLIVGKVSSIGLGIGYRRYFEKENAGRYLISPESQIPVFLDLRTCFTRKKITPYLAFDIGSSAGYISDGSDSTKTTSEGLFLSGSGGAWFNISDRFAVFAGAAFEMQNLEYMLVSDHSHFRRNSSSLSLNLGIAF
ncbi:MAG TPA: hypothetical protein PLV06_02880 [Bacteroidales bacterium]|nr:hypothetical protein [Bacteroidales bacterium]